MNSVPINNNDSAANYPWTSKRVFQLTIDNTAATKKEPFFCIQVNYSGTGSAKVCIDSGYGYVNAVYVPFSGAIIPVCGIGFVSSGADCHGASHSNVGTNITVLAYGGNKTES